MGSTGSPHESGAYGWAGVFFVARTATTPIGAPRSRLRGGLGGRPRHWDRPSSDGGVLPRCSGSPRWPSSASASGWLGRDWATLVDWSVDADTLRALCIAGLLWALFCYTAAADAALASWPARFEPQRGSGRGHPARGVGRGGRPSPGHRLRARDGAPGQPARHRVRRVLGRRAGRPAEPPRRSRHHDRADHRPRRHRRPTVVDGDHDRPADDRRHHRAAAASAPAGSLEHRPARRRCRAEPLGAAHRHDDRRQHRPPDRRSGQRVRPPQPQVPAHAARAAARPLPQRLRRPGQRRCSPTSPAVPSSASTRPSRSRAAWRSCWASPSTTTSSST